MFNPLEKFAGQNGMVWFIGVVEDNNDPMNLGRVKVRCFGYHPEDRTMVPTSSLPWAQVVQPTTSASTSGIGFSPNGLKPSSWVIGFFADGDDAQYPFILGSLPGIHRPSNSASYIGNSGAGYLNDSDMYSGDATEGPWDPTPPINPSTGAVIRDDGSYLTKQNIGSWPLQKYKYTPAYGDYGLACKDGNSSLRIHYASVLALENLGKSYGTYPKINSAYRTPAYNASIGGAKHSMHIEGRAFDIPYSSIGGKSKSVIARFAQTAVQNGFVGFGLYDTFIHIDTGTGRTWNGAKSDWFISAIKQAGWYPGKRGLQDVRTNTSTANTSSSGIGSDTAASQTSDTGSDAAETNDTKSGTTGATSLGDDRDTVIRTVYGEARGEGSLGQTAVAYVIKNRQGDTRWPNTAGGVSKQPSQFSVWNDGGSAMSNLTPSDPQYQSIGRIVDSVWAGTVEDPTNGAVYYYNPNVANPSWASSSDFQNNVSTIGNHRFGGRSNGVGVAQGSSWRPGYTDPTGSLPYGAYKGKPSTHPNARGVNSNLYQPDLAKNSTGRLTSFPTAGDRGTVGEPDIGEAPQYPYNFTYTSMSGHLWEYDDTPGVERVNFQHKSGSRLAMGAKGTLLLKSYGNAYHVTSGDMYNLIMGAYNVCAKDDIDIRTTSDMTVHADGNYTKIVLNDDVEYIAGKKDVLVGEVLQIKAKRIIFEADDIDIVAHNSMNTEVGGNATTRVAGNKSETVGGNSGTSVKGNNNMSTDGDTTINSAGGFHADAASLHWQEGETSKVKPLEENSAKSTDLGTAPARVKVEKVPYQKANPDAVDTLDDSTERYSA